MLPSYDIWSIFIISEKKIFCFTHFSRNGKDFEMSQLKKFKNFIVMPKNFLMTVDMIAIAGLSCFLYVILSYSYYFQATFSFQGCSVKENLMFNI